MFGPGSQGFATIRVINGVNDKVKAYWKIEERSKLVIVATSAGLPFIAGLSSVAFSSQYLKILLVTKKTEMRREKNSPMAEETGPIPAFPVACDDICMCQ